MKKILLSLLLVIPFLGNSQITITSSDMPDVNDTFRLSVINGPDTIDITNTGANWIWDYSFLQPQLQKVDTFVNTFNTDPQYYLNFNLPWDQAHFASYAQPVLPPPAFDPSFKVEDVYYYYKETSSQFTLVGFGAKLNGISISQQYNPVDVIYEFPLNFGNTNTSTSSFNYDFPQGNDYYGRTTERTNTVDGWGTLTTPFGTFQTLRVRSQLKITDTLYVDTLSFGFTLPRPTQFEYKWLAKNEGDPILQINTQKALNTEVINDITYRDSVRLDVIGIRTVPSEETAFNIFPNPNNGKFILKFDNENEINSQIISIVNLLGEEMMNFKKSGRDKTGSYEIDLSNLGGGVYFLIAGNKSGKIIVTKE